MLAKIGWPQAAIVMTLIVCVCALALAGPALGVPLDSLRYVLGGSSVLGIIGAWLTKAPGAK